MKPPAVQSENLGKSFRIYPRPSDRLIEWLSLGRKNRHLDFWALKHINFTVDPGECVGLIGPNGAGKSTLLRILSKTLWPTEGSFSINGRALSLLELGTGFNTELTGRQNVLHTAQLLGLPEGYAQSRLVDIESFADLGPFIDRAIKTYSSGMTLRLAFAMFAFFEPDVLIIDEALAVGDAAFQRKCFRRLEELVADSKRAVILVSHDLQSIIKFCDRVYWIDKGNIRQSGDPQTVVQEYLRETFAGDRKSNVPGAHGESSIAGGGEGKLESELRTSSVERRTSNVQVEEESRSNFCTSKFDVRSSAFDVRISSCDHPLPETLGNLARSPAAIIYPSKGVDLLGLWIENQSAAIPVDARFAICYVLRFTKPVARPVFGIRIATTRGDVMIAANTQMMQVITGNFAAGEAVTIRWPILPGLAVGDYFVSCGCSLEDDVHHFLMREVDGYQFSITGERKQAGLCSLNGVPQCNMGVPPMNDAHGRDAHAT